MKRKILQIGCVLMAIYVLFIAHGLNINFHLCNENHHLMTSFGDASLLCEHCLGHHHDHMHANEFEDHLQERHFDAKCCCQDFEGEIGFTDQFTFSPEKSLVVFLPSTLLISTYQIVLEEKLSPVSHLFTRWNIPYLLSGRLKTIFFSHLKLNPLVF